MKHPAATSLSSQPTADAYYLAMEFSVHMVREYDDGTTATYLALVEAPSSADAGSMIGNKIRANDLDGVQVTGTHEPVPAGAQAGIRSLKVHRVGE
jgi:hypothetical protein